MIFDKIKMAYQDQKMVKVDFLARAELGRRELVTFKTLSKEVGFVAPKSGVLLDLGCADRFLEPACNSEYLKYIGLDYLDVNFEAGVLPVADDTVDIVMSLAVIEHLRDPGNFLSEIYRCLKPGGVVYLSTPNFQLDWKNFYNDPTHVHPYTPESLEQLLKLSGFSSVKSFPGLRCKDVGWYRGKWRFVKAFYFLPFRGDTRWPVPSFMKGHARSVFAIGKKPCVDNIVCVNN
jgi:SAM-dependent methyltransferase